MAETHDEEQDNVALVAVDRRTVRLETVRDAIVAVRTVEGDIYVPLRPLCETLGLDVQGQTQRIRRHDALAQNLKRVAVPTETRGTQLMLCLELEGLPLWLAGIETSRVRGEIRPTLTAYQMWARRRIYEAFVAETGLVARSGEGTAVTSSDDEEPSPLDQIEAFGVALTAFARQQRAFERRYVVDQETVQARLDHLDSRIDHAAEAFADLVRDVRIRLDGSDVITDAQASDIKALIQAIATDRTSPGDKSGTQYRTLWSELYRRFRVPSYARIKQSQYHDVIQWLEAERRTGE